MQVTKTPQVLTEIIVGEPTSILPKQGHIQTHNLMLQTLSMAGLARLEGEDLVLDVPEKTNE